MSTLVGPASGALSEPTLHGRSTATDNPSTVLRAELESLPKTKSTSPLAFFHLIERLKTTKREGWRRFDINHGESISDHMYRMSIITLLCPPALASRIDLARCTKMALVHDMAEALVGDITPVDGVAKSEKSRREADTMDYLCTSLLGNVHGGVAGQQIREVWQEYEDSKTLESHFVHDVDKMELLLQMIEYERDHKGQLDLGEFSRVAKRIELPEVMEWASELLQERREFWKEHGKEPTGVQDISEDLKKMQDDYYRGSGANSQTMH